MNQKQLSMEVVTRPYSYDNYAYLIICNRSREAAVVDPGEGYPVLQSLEQHGVQLRKILCTHHHADHIGGISDLLDELGELQIYGHASDRQRISGLGQTVEQGDVVRVGSLTAEVIHTPGHTSGSICYVFAGAVFTGDTLFGGGCGRLFEGSPGQMYDSMNRLANRFEADTKIYFGHEYTAANLKFAQFVEPDNAAVKKRLADAVSKTNDQIPTSPSVAALELDTNPFLRSHLETIAAALQKKDGIEYSDPEQVFTALRKLKDNF